MAPVSPELCEKIKELAATLTNVSITYRYTKARAMLDPEFAEKLKEQYRRSAQKKYENPEYRAKQIQKLKDYQPVSLEKQKEKYHTDPEYREKKLAQARLRYQQKKAEKLQQSNQSIVDTIPI
jgi:hypothetical protein